MLIINSFSIHDLVGFAVNAPLALLFYIVYLTMGRRLIDLLFANWLACVAALCLNFLLIDNVVPEGALATAVPNAGALTLQYVRSIYLLGLVAMVTMSHFVLLYTKSRYATSTPMWLAYPACLAAIPLIWSPWFLREQTQPLAAQTSTFTCAVPWFPQVGAWVTGYLALEFAVLALLVVILWRHKADTLGPPEAGAMSMIAWVRAAFVILCLSGTLDILMAVMGWLGPAPFPIGAILVAGAISVALVGERRAAERHSVHMEEQLRIANDIQTGLLPQGQPAVAGFEVAGWSRPAETAGGDTYDVFQLPDGRWLITLADASGHGLGPALIVDETRAILRALTVGCEDAATILTHARRLLASDLPESHFVTCFVGLLDPASATLSYASAGQGPIICFESAGGQFRGENAASMPLLSFTSSEFECTVRHQRFEPGDFLVLVSDGLYEAFDRSRNQFGIARLFEALRKGPRLRSQELISHVLKEVEAFMGGCKQADDMTMLVLRKE
jgi:serine phosphatase RsbU (regulator of sigma subunit)